MKSCSPSPWSLPWPMGLPALDSFWGLIPTETGLSPHTGLPFWAVWEHRAPCMSDFFTAFSNLTNNIGPTVLRESHAALLRPHQAGPRSILSSAGWQIPEPFSNTHKARQDTEWLWAKVQKMRTKRYIRMMGAHLILTTAIHLSFLFCKKQLGNALH